MVESVKGGGSKWRGKEGWRVGVMESGEGGEGLEGGGWRGRDGVGRKGETLVWSEGGRGAGLTHLGSSSPVPIHGCLLSLMSHGGSHVLLFIDDGEGPSSPLWSFAC